MEFKSDSKVHLLLNLETSRIIYLWELDCRIIIICLVWWWHVLMLMLTVATDKRMTITQLKCACLILILWLLRWWNFKASSDGYPSPFSSNWHCLFLLVVCCGEKILPSISFSFFFFPFCRTMIIQHSNVYSNHWVLNQLLIVWIWKHEVPCMFIYSPARNVAGSVSLANIISWVLTQFVGHGQCSY